MRKAYLKAIATLILQLMLCLPLSFALSIANVSSSSITDSTAEIRWDTDEASSSRVNYGKNTLLGDHATDSDLVRDHQVKLTGLQESTQYFFEVVSNDAADNNNGTYYFFTTSQDVEPFIRTNIPEYHSSHELDLSIDTDPESLVDVRSDGEWKRGYADEEGRFLVSGLRLKEGLNELHIKAEDPRGHIREEIFEVIVDTKKPALAVSDTGAQVEDDLLELNGSVDEQATVTITVEYRSADQAAPGKVMGLNQTVVEDNSVEFEWQESDADDFKEYLVYRDGRRIAGRKSPNFADQVNTSTTYVYEVSAVDKNCNEGPKSDALAITTLSGVRNISGRVREYELKCRRGEETVIETNGTFTAELQLDKDGFYLITIEASDLANNTARIERNVHLDTEPPQIEDIYPENGAQIFEQFANEVDIRGRTDPNARVYLYVERTPLGRFNKTVDVYGIPNQIHHLDEADLDADCGCSSGADYVTTADAEGYFVFENVDITSSAAVGYRMEEVDYEDLQDRRELYIREHEMEADLLFISTDVFGRRGAEAAHYNVQTCWSGDKLWSATPLLRYQSPAFISTERLAEGTETLYFYFNFTYWGDQNDKPIVHAVDIQRACDDYITADPKYNYSCQVMRDGSTKVEIINGRTAYVVYRLKRFDLMDAWSVDEWKEFFKSLEDNEMLFPLKFTLRYEYTNATGKQVQGTQTFCDTVAYYVDMARVDPRSVLPDWLLYDFVDTLDEVIEKTTDWMGKLEKILEYAALGCMISYFTKFFMKFVRNFQCRMESITKLTKIVGGQQTPMCEQCIVEFDGYTGDISSIDMNALSDTCLRHCYPACYNAWQMESSWYKFFRWTCDRLFGHSSPAGWTRNRQSNELQEKASMGSTCTNDQSTKGRPLKAVNCRDVEKTYGYEGRFTIYDKCVEMYGNEASKRTKTLYTIGASQGNYVYQLNHITGPQRIEYLYAIKQNENSYLTFQPKSCAELCGVMDSPGIGSTGTIYGASLNDNVIQQSSPSGGNEESKTAALCTTPNQCRSFYQKQYNIGEESWGVNRAEPAGYTQDCFYGVGHPSLNSLDAVSGDPNKRMECCCLSSSADTSFSQYYVPNDVESKTRREPPFQAAHADSYEDMAWSYRYHLTHWKATGSLTGSVRDRYDPHRYIDGRDFSACFGQNHIWYGEDELILDPSTDHLATFQCVSISGIYNRLAFIRNLAQMLKSCLLQVRTTGKADSGVCKELFSQYVCSMIWKILVWVRDGCSPFGSLQESDEASWSTTIVAGVGSLLDSVKESQMEMAAEYGNADLNSIFGMGEEAIVRKVCLAAFGYDWDLSVENFMDAAYASPYATFVQAVLPGREYLTFDPVTGKSVYEYKASWLINPGCNFDDYDVYLSCISQNELAKYGDIRCDKVESPQKPDCACMNQDREITRLLYDGDSLSQNVLEDIDHTMIPSGNRIVRDRYRYDHIKIVIDARNIERGEGDVSKCFPDGHAEGDKGIFYFPIKDYTPSELAACYVDAESGTYDCSQGASFLHPFGQAYVTGINIGPDKQDIDLRTLGGSEETGAILYPGDKLEGEVTYFKDNKLQCMTVKLLDKARKAEESYTQTILLHEGDTGVDTQSFRLNKRIEEDDASPYAMMDPSISYQRDGNTANGGLSIYITDSQRFPPGERKSITMEFIDTDNNGIQLDENSNDKYSINNKRVAEIRKMCQNDICEFDFDRYFDVEITATISNVNMEGAAGSRVFTVVFEKSKQRTKSIDEPSYYLHVDLRSPLDEESNCNLVSHAQYDETQIIVREGVKQSFDIPIYIGMGERGNRCDEDTYLDGQKQCVCSARDSVAGMQENCPDGEYHYCSDGVCRKYPECPGAGAVADRCVCGRIMGSDEADYYNCGYAGAKTAEEKADYQKPNYVPGNPEEYRYCYAKEGESSRCHKEAYAELSSDTSPPVVSYIMIQGEYGDVIAAEGDEVEIRATIREETKLESIKLEANGLNQEIKSIAPDIARHDGSEIYTMKWDTSSLHTALYGVPVTIAIIAADGTNEPVKATAAGKITIESKI